MASSWSENERKQMINALNRIADNLGRLANRTKIKGKWQWQKCTILGEEMHAWVCSQCGFMATGVAIDNARYCPNCGLKMQIDEDITEEP